MYYSRFLTKKNILARKYLLGSFIYYVTICHTAPNSAQSANPPPFHSHASSNSISRGLSSPPPTPSTATLLCWYWTVHSSMGESPDQHCCSDIPPNWHSQKMTWLSSKVTFESVWSTCPPALNHYKTLDPSIWLTSLVSSLTHYFLSSFLSNYQWWIIHNNKDWTYRSVGSTDLERRLVQVLLVSIRPFFIHSCTIPLLQATSTLASTLFLGKRWPSSLNLLKPSTCSLSMNPRSTRLSPEALVYAGTDVRVNPPQLLVIMLEKQAWFC